MEKEKALIKVKEPNIFAKIKNFIKNIFNKKVAKQEDDNFEFFSNNENLNNDFNKYIKCDMAEENRLLMLQLHYEQGNITEDDISKEDIAKLSELYDEQIRILKKSNELRLEKILKYRQHNSI